MLRVPGLLSALHIFFPSLMFPTVSVGLLVIEPPLSELPQKCLLDLDVFEQNPRLLWLLHHTPDAISLPPDPTVTMPKSPGQAQEGVHQPDNDSSSIVPSRQPTTNSNDGAVHEDIGAQSDEEELISTVAPRLTDIISYGNPGLVLPDCLRNNYGEDAFFRNILAKSEDYKNFELADGLMFLKDSERRILCIPGHSRRISMCSRSNNLACGLDSCSTRCEETFYYLRDDVQAFCHSCSLCQTGKSRNYKPYGPLQPLAVPQRPWESIGIDFVGPLPEARNRLGAFDMISTII